METEIWGNPLSRWLIALGIAVGSYFALGVLKRLVVYRIGQFAKQTETDVDDMFIDLVQRTRPLFLAAIAAWIGSHFLWLSPQAIEYRPRAMHLFLFLQGGMWAVGLLDYGVGKMLGSGPKDQGRTKGVSVLSLIGRALIWATIALLALQNVFVVNVLPLLTGLGVGGIAIALALQNVLGDLFASISILLDKPFVVGDAIVVGEFNGTVEHIGIKTTRLKSVNGEQLIMGNADLSHSRIRNYKRLEERRIVFSVGVTYQTPRATLERIPAMLKEAVQKGAQVRFDRAHFHKFADFALVYEVAYFVQHPDYQTYMDAQQAINFEILRRFEAEKIEFAYPTQVVLQGPAAPR